MKRYSYFNFRKGMVVSVLAVALLSAFLVPLYAQEDFSPAEEAEETENTAEDGTEGVAGTESNIKAVLWKNEQSGQLYANSAVKFILDSMDNLSQTDYIEYKINESDYIRYSSPITLAKEGPHSITYRAIDRAGNREFDQSFNVIVDNKPPEVELTPAQAFVKRDGRLYTSPGNTFTLRAVDQYSGVKVISYGVNSAVSEKYEEGRTVQLSDPGSQLIQYKAVDNLGNGTQNGSVLVEVDGSRPRVSIRPTQPLKQVNGSRYARKATGFVVSARDEGAGISQIMVRIDGAQEWQAYSSPLYFATEQQHSIEAKAVDAVGNESETIISQFNVDDNPPVTRLRSSLK